MHGFISTRRSGGNKDVYALILLQYLLLRDLSSDIKFGCIDKVSQILRLLIVNNIMYNQLSISR